MQHFVKKEQVCLQGKNLVIKEKNHRCYSRYYRSSDPQCCMTPGLLYVLLFSSTVGFEPFCLFWKELR